MNILKKVGDIFGKQLIGHVGKSFSDDSGNPSSMRLMTCFVIMVVLGNWTYANITTGTMGSFGNQDLMLILGPLLNQSFQKGIEKKVAK